MERLCACGCGFTTKPYARTHRSLGRIAGEPAEYLKGHADTGMNVIGSESFAERFWSRVQRASPNECWLWTGMTCGGYGRIKVNGQAIGAHRIAWTLTNGATPLDICHKCDNPPCCNPAHLFAAEHVVNMRDMAEKLRHPHKLNHEAVVAIRAMATARIRQSTIASVFGIDRGHISAIVARKRRTAR